MRNTKQLLSILLATAIGITACDDYYSHLVDVDLVTASVPQPVCGNIETKALSIDTDNCQANFSWIENIDKISIFSTDSQNNEPIVYSVKEVNSQESNSCTFLVENPKLKDGKTYYAFYPGDYSDNPNFLLLDYTTQRQENANDDSHLSKYSYMVSNATTASQTDGANFTFQHQSAWITFTILVQKEFTAEQIRLSTSTTDAFLTKGKLDLTTGEVIPSKCSNTIILNLGTTKNGLKISANIYNYTFMALRALKPLEDLKVELIGTDENGEFSITRDMPTTMTYAPGTYNSIMFKEDGTEIMQASIGNVGYPTFADALAAVPTDGTETTIKLLSNLTMESNSGIEISKNQNIILNLNGKTIKSLVKESSASFVISNSGTLKITGNGTITNALGDVTIADSWPTDSYATNLISNTGSLTIENGTLSNTLDSGISYALESSTNGENTNVTINNGTIKSAGNSAINMLCNSTSFNNAITINNGYFEGKYNAINICNGSGSTNKGTLNINNGEFESVATTKNVCIANWASNKSSNITITIANGKFNDYVVIASKSAISGGLFKYNQYIDTENSKEYNLIDYIHEDYNLVDNQDATTKGSYPYTTAEKPTLLTIGGVEYKHFSKAMAAAKSGDEVKIVVPDTYVMSESGISQLPAGVTITGGEGVVFDCVGDGNIISITNGVTFKNVTLKMGPGGYHGFQHSGFITFKDCIINDYYKTYSKTKFDGCTFNQTEYEYCLHLYHGDVDIVNCTFNNLGKTMYVYTEANASPYTINVTGCTFNVNYTGQPKAKAAVFVKNNVAGQKYNVYISGCTVNPTGEPHFDDPDLTNGGDIKLWNVEELPSGPAGNGVYVYLENSKVYPKD